MREECTLNVRHGRKRIHTDKQSATRTYPSDRDQTHVGHGRETTTLIYVCYLIAHMRRHKAKGFTKRTFNFGESRRQRLVLRMALWSVLLQLLQQQGVTRNALHRRNEV